MGYFAQAYYADRSCERVGCFFDDFCDPHDETLGPVDMDAGTGIWRSEILAVLWGCGHGDNEERNKDGGVLVPVNDHWPWYCSLNDAVFWM